MKISYYFRLPGTSGSLTQDAQLFLESISRIPKRCRQSNKWTDFSYSTSDQSTAVVLIGMLWLRRSVEIVFR